MIDILYEDNHILVVYKKKNVPVCKDESNDLDLLTILKKYIKEKYNKPGDVFLALVHRLDRPVSGVMVFAKTSKSASRLSDQVRKHELKKTYYAVVLGKVNENGTLKNNLLKDKKTNITKVDKNGKEAILTYELIDYKNDLSLVKINLKTGRSHQIRVQFSYINHPLYGDLKYNNKAKVGENIALFAQSLEFTHPTTKEKLNFSLDLPDVYPYNLFK